MCQHCRQNIEEALIEASRDPHLIALVLAGYTEAKWFREHLRLTILRLRARDGTPADLAERLTELGSECPAVSSHCGRLLQQATTVAEVWCGEPASAVSDDRRAFPRSGPIQAH